MLKITIIFCFEIHFVNFNLVPDCTCRAIYVLSSIFQTVKIKPNGISQSYQMDKSIDLDLHCLHMSHKKDG